MACSRGGKDSVSRKAAGRGSGRRPRSGTRKESIVVSVVLVSWEVRVRACEG